MHYQGFIKKVISQQLVLVETGTQQWRIIASGEFARLGGHRCGLQNVPVSFAFDGRRVTDFKIDLPDHDGEQEVSTIIYSGHDGTPSGFGFLQRNDCRCSLAFHHSEVVTYGSIRVGAECRHCVGRFDNRAVAEEIELYQQ
jgi:hypothetical protein